jgi:hypothetical protein
MREPTTNELMEIERQAERDIATGEDPVEALIDAIEVVEKELLRQEVKKVEKRNRQEGSKK